MHCRSAANARKYTGNEKASTYNSLDLSNNQTVQHFPSFIAVAYILKGFRRILSTDIEKDFFTATIKNEIKVGLV